MSLPAPPLIRVARKRSAGSHSAVLVNVKRRRADPLLFSLHSTQETPSAPVPNAKIIDYARSTQGVATVFEETTREDIDAEPLSEFMDAVGEASLQFDRASPAVAARDIITMNGRPLVICGENDLLEYTEGDDDLVYDFYEMRKGDVVDAEDQDLEMRFASKEEFDLWMGAASDSESDLSDNSNDENNWRNEYPDEESCSEEDSDTYSDDSELGVSGEGWDGLGMHRLKLNDDLSNGFEEYGYDNEDSDVD